MPIYEYRRPDGTTFEIQQSFSDDSLSVDPDTGVPVERVLHAPAVHFKGKGFYNTDYGTRNRQRETAANNAAEKSSEKSSSSAKDSSSSSGKDSSSSSGKDSSSSSGKDSSSSSGSSSGGDSSSSSSSDGKGEKASKGSAPSKDAKPVAAKG
jgi:predicted nucleic acid-binding Zn ribbon protein